MDLEQNPFAFLGEEEDTDILIQNAKASAAAAALASKEAALEEAHKDKKKERKNERISMRAKRIILPRYVTKRDIVVRKEKPQGEGDANGDNKGNFQKNSGAEAHKSNGFNKETINKLYSYNGHVNNNFTDDNNNRAEVSWSKSKNNVYSSNGHCNGHHHGGSSGFSNGGYQGKYRRGFNGYANNGGLHLNQGFSRNNSNVSNQKLEKKVEQASDGVEKNEEEDGWTKVEKRRSKGRRSGSYQSSQVSTVSEKDTILEDVQEVSNVENNASEKDTTYEGVQEVNNASEKDTTCEDVQEVNNTSENELDGEGQQDIDAENNVAEAVNGENKSNKTERQQKSNAADEKPRTTKNESQKRKNKKNIEVARIVHQKKEEQVTDGSQKMTLQEYEKSLLEKRKHLESLKKTDNNRVIQLKDFESMVHVGKKTEDSLSINQNAKDSHNYKKDGHKEEQKGHKVVSTVELRKKWGLTFNHPGKPYGGGRGGYHVGKSDKNEPVKGNGAAPETEKQQQHAKGGHVQKTKANKLSGFEKRGHHKNADASLEGVAEKTLPLPPIFDNLEQFPNLGGKAA